MNQSPTLGGRKTLSVDERFSLSIQPGSSATSEAKCEFIEGSGIMALFQPIFQTREMAARDSAAGQRAYAARLLPRCGRSIATSSITRRLDFLRSSLSASDARRNTEIAINATASATVTHPSARITHSNMMTLRVPLSERSCSQNNLRNFLSGRSFVNLAALHHEVNLLQ